MRPGEVDGVDYHFLTPRAFADAVDAGEFLEHVEYAGNRYGTLRREVDAHLAVRQSVIVEIELKGARAIRSMSVPFPAPDGPEITRTRAR